MKKILLLGGSPQQVIAIDTAKRLGLETILCDYLPDNPGRLHADRYYPVSTTDKAAVLDIAKKEKVNGILAYATDPAAPTAAYVAEKLGLHTNPYHAVETLCDKEKFRTFLKSHGYHVPKSAVFATEEDAVNGFKEINAPVLLKPVDSSGSKGVTLLKDGISTEDLQKAISGAFSYSRCHRVIAEEYIEKAHPYLIGGDIFVSHGKVILWGLMNCHRSSLYPLVPAGKSYHLLLSEDNLCKVQNTLQKIVTDLGIRSGPLNVELIIDVKGYVYPIDIGPRSGGNRIPELLGRIFDCDMVEMSIRNALGEDINDNWSEGIPCYASWNLHAVREGIFESLEISSKIRPYIVKEYLYVQQGDAVHVFQDASHAMGVLFLRFQDTETMHRMMREMDSYVRVIYRKA